VPPVAAALHPPTTITAEVRAGVKLLKDELHSSKQQGDIVLKARVASVCFDCFS
jgi:hypothetical protein